MAYVIRWKYEQKEGERRAILFSLEALADMLRFLNNDDESNRTYVRVTGPVGGVVPTDKKGRVLLSELCKHTNNGYRYSGLEDYEGE